MPSIKVFGLLAIAVVLPVLCTEVLANDIFIQNTRVIDGLGNPPIESRDIHIRDGRIVSVSAHGQAGPVPGNAQIIDGAGLSVLPGLIDLHVHLGATDFTPEGNLVGSDKSTIKPATKALNALLYAGITTAMDLGNQFDFIVSVRDALQNGELSGPRLVITGETIQRIHSIDGAMELPTKGIQEINEVLDRHEAEGIKIMKLYTGVTPWGARFYVREANKRGIRMVADFWCSNLSYDIFRVSDIAAYGHGSCGEVSAEYARWMANNGKFAMMTLTIFEAMGGQRARPDYEVRGYMENPLIVDALGTGPVENYYKYYDQIRNGWYDSPKSIYIALGFDDLDKLLGYNFKNVRTLHEAGVLLGMGTDGNFPAGNWFGDSLHREMELHAAAGLQPVDIIQIATHNGAKILGLDNDIGSVEAGKIADLLVVAGNPAENISDSRNVHYVIQNGAIVDRAALRSQ